MAALPPAYADFLASMEQMMRRARKLGLYRTTESLHEALYAARAEVWEVIPPVTVTFTIGPVEEQE